MRLLQLLFMFCVLLNGHCVQPMQSCSGTSSDWILFFVGIIIFVYISFLTVTHIIITMKRRKEVEHEQDNSILFSISIIIVMSYAIEFLLHHNRSTYPFIPDCSCEDDVEEYWVSLCQCAVSVLIIGICSMLGCTSWSSDLIQGSKFVLLLTASHLVSCLLSYFVIFRPVDGIFSERWAQSSVMCSGDLLGVLLVHLFCGRKGSTDSHLLEEKRRKLNERMNHESQASSRRSSAQGHTLSEDDDESLSHRSERSFQSAKYRWNKKKQHPYSARFGKDAFLPCVVLMKKGRSSPPVAVNVTNIGIASQTVKPAPPRLAHRRASLGVTKERDDAATWARLATRRRTSLPTTFHSSRKQNVMSSVLVESSVIAELHTVLDKLSVASSETESEILTEQMQTLLQPYKNENLRPNQVVWLHDSVSSTSDGSDDEDIRGSRGVFNKRVVNRRPEWNPDSVWTTTTSATGLPSQDPGPIKSRRLPIIKTPSNTPHDSRCSSPTSGRDLAGMMGRRRTIHTIGPGISSPARTASFFTTDDVDKDAKEIRRVSLPVFTSSDYESCDNLLTDGSEGETVKQMPDLQQPNARRGNSEGSTHDSDQSPKIRMLITEPTIDEDEEEASASNSTISSPSNAGSPETSRKSSYVETYEGDLSPEQIKKIFHGAEYEADILEKVYSWNFPIFELADKTHCVLSQMAYKLFDDTGLFESFKIPRKPFVEYMCALENGYRNIPYHNRIHAADVLHGCWFLTTQEIPGFSETSPLFSSDSSDSDSGTAHTQVNTVGNGSLAQAIPALELMALYLAAAMHDYDHPGRTNAFLVDTRHPLAMLYNDRSVLENHHASASWELLHTKPTYNFLVNLDLAEWKRLRVLIVEAILATDLKKHFELMSKFTSKIARRNEANSENESLRHEGCLKWTVDEDRLLVCQMVIKLADIGGPTKERSLHVTWTKAICQEFFTQGDEERQLESQVSPFMDRERPQVAQLQRTFIKNLIAPLVCKMHRAGILAGYSDEEEEAEEDNILEPTEEYPAVACRSFVREQLADNLRYWHAILQRDLDGHEEMEEVFACCHEIKLEHENFDTTDADFPKKLRENRRERLHKTPDTTACNKFGKGAKS